MKIISRTAILSLAAPAALLALAPSSPPPETYAPSAETVAGAVRLAHVQAKEAGGKPGPVD